MDLTSTLRNARRTARRHGPAAAVRFLAVAAVRRGITFERAHVYSLDARSARDAAPNGRTRLATVEDLSALTRDPVWELGDLRVGDLERLFARGHLCVINVVGGAIAGYGWLSPDRMVVPKLRMALSLRPDEAHVYKDFTHPDYRGQQLGARRYLHWLHDDPRRRLLTDFAFDNVATHARVRHLGLHHVGTATYLSLGHHERLRLSAGLVDRVVTPVPWPITQVEAATLPLA